MRERTGELTGPMTLNHPVLVAVRRDGNLETEDFRNLTRLSRGTRLTSDDGA